MWLQWDWGEGPRIAGRRTQLFCAWLAWSKFRVVLPSWDQTLGSLTACMDATLRIIGAAPTYLLTDNPRTVTVEHIAKIPVRHPQMVELGRHYGCAVHTCEPFDPESKGGVENTVKIAKADLVPTTTNLRSSYGSFAELEDACARWAEQVNHRMHRATHRLPAHMLGEELARLHPLPADPYALALGEERLVGEDRTVRWGDVRYSVPPGHEGRKVWCRVHGDELVIVGRRTHTGPGGGPGGQHPGGAGLAELWRHQLSTPGRPRIVEAHYPDHPGGNGPRQPRARPQTKAEERFLAITAAVFGQHWPEVLAEKARQITIPIEFDMQWDDEHISREEGLALFDAFASKEKSLHVNSGKHKELPRFEVDSAVRFFARHLGGVVTASA